MPIYNLDESYIKRKLTILNEYYIGKNIYTERLLKDISELRNSSAASYFTDNYLNKSIEMNNLMNDISEIFGFSCVQIMVCEDRSINAFTIFPLTSNIDSKNYKKYIKFKKDRIYYTKEANMKIIVFMNRGLVFSPKLSDGEIVAMLLHEIGHNFEHSVSPTIKGLQFVSDILNVTRNIGFIIDGIYLTYTGINLGDIDIKHSLYTAVQSMANKYETYEYNYYLNKIRSESLNEISLIDIKNSVKIVTSNIIKKIILPILGIKYISHRLNTASERREEIFSDSFATLFGYGSELSSCLSKSEDIEFVPLQNITSNKYLNALLIPLQFIEELKNPDPHPKTISRLKIQMDYIKREISKDDLKPEIKQELKNQLESIQKDIDYLSKIPKDSNVYYNVLFSLLLTKFDKFTISGIASRAYLFEEIDKAFEKIEQEA